MVKRHDLLEKRLERAESTLSTKSETKATVQREVHNYVTGESNIIIMDAPETKTLFSPNNLQFFNA